MSDPVMVHMVWQDMRDGKPAGCGFATEYMRVDAVKQTDRKPPVIAAGSDANPEAVKGFADLLAQYIGKPKIVPLPDAPKD